VNDRNKPCPCGSGRKVKHCPGPHLEDIEAAYRENAEREHVRRLRLRGVQRGRLGVLALAALAIDPPRRR
jgi:SEC-C motif